MSAWKELKNQIEHVVIDSIALGLIKKHLINVITTEKRSREKARAKVGLKTLERFKNEAEELYYGRKKA